MKNNHLKTAVKALKKQRQVYEEKVKKYAQDEIDAAETKVFFERELNKLDEQIAILEKDFVPEDFTL